MLTNKQILTIFGVITLVILLITNTIWIHDFFTYPNYPDLKEVVYKHTFFAMMTEAVFALVAFIALPPLEHY